MKEYIYIVCFGAFESQTIIESGYLLYKDARRSALELVENTNEIIRNDNDSISDSLLGIEDIEENDIPHIKELQEVNEDFWCSDTEWVGVKKIPLK